MWLLASTGKRSPRCLEVGQRFELALAKDFVDRLDSLPKEETGGLLFQVDARTRRARRTTEIINFLDGKTILGLPTETGRPRRPEGPSVACWVRLTEAEALVQVLTSDAKAKNWVPFGKFSIAADQGTKISSTSENSRIDSPRESSIAWFGLSCPSPSRKTINSSIPFASTTHRH